MNPETRTRLLSALAALVVVIPMLLWGGFWGISGLAFGVVVWALHEMATLLMPEQRRWAFPAMLGFGAPIFALAALCTSEVVPGLDVALPDRFLVLLTTLVIAVQGSAILVLFTAKSTEGLADRWARFLLSLLYAPLLMGLLPALVQLEGGLAWVWVPLVVGFFGDIGGYFAGRAFGKHKMLPTISPKKTWEGFFGGVGLAVVGLMLFKVVFFGMIARDGSSMTWLDCVVLGVVGDVAGVVGDLVESMIKRTVGAKDSGRFLPGHGGMLDRIDSVLFVAPVVTLWLVVFRPLVLG